jgi:hypothetical protein|tara:strand:- start:26005 stop:26538 length:534 start_codon:yes stop_codon:yes gene_type:complete
MSRKISVNARLAHDAIGSDHVEVVLLQITHPETEQVIRISSDPTERISYSPLSYGTRSNWLGADPTNDDQAFLFVLVSVLLPDDEEDRPPSARFVIEGIDNDLVEVLTSTIERAQVSMAVVLHSSPNVIEQEWLGFELLSAKKEGEGVVLSISRDPVTAEPWPMGRMTRERFPGLHP